MQDITIKTSATWDKNNKAKVCSVNPGDDALVLAVDRWILRMNGDGVHCKESSVYG